MLIYDKPPLGSYLPLPRGWPLNEGLTLGSKPHELMNEALFNLGFDEVDLTSSKNILITREKKMVEKEWAIQKLIYGQ